jgi:DNA-binding NtrC family response regulator
MALTKVGRTLAEIEREHILETLTYCEGNRTYAAVVLDISVRGLRNKLNDYSRAGWTVSRPGCTPFGTASRSDANGANGIVWC